jgi:serine/threonine-protein kinase RsbW
MKNITSKTFKSDPKLLPEIENFILKAIEKEFQLSDSKKNNIELAVAEAAANCVKHGNKSNPEKNLKLNISKNTNKIIIAFKDEGKGFDPKNVPDPTIPENILKGSGRGIYIMKNLVDDMKFNFEADGTELILSFNI